MGAFSLLATLSKFANRAVTTPLCAGREQLLDVVRLQFNEVRQAFRDRHQIELDMTNSEYAHILDIAHQPKYGARPLRRYINETIVTELSIALLKKQLKPNSIATGRLSSKELGAKPKIVWQFTEQTLVDLPLRAAR